MTTYATLIRQIEKEGKLMLTLLLLAAVIVTPAQATPEINTPEVIITIAPSSMDSFQLLRRRRSPDTYTCEALVREATSNQPWIHAELILLPGTSDTITERVGDYSLEFTVKMMTMQANTTVTVKRGDKVLTRQRSTVYLRPMPSGRIIPVH
jgi:hypothetical protein